MHFKQRLYGTLVTLIILPFIFHDAVRILKDVDAKEGISATFLNAAPATVSLLNYLQGSRKAGTLTSAGVPSSGDYSLTANGQQTLSAEEIDAVLEGWNSPAKRSGYLWVQAGQKYDIDAAIALAQFEFESGAGSNPKWDASTMNPGNIRADSNSFRRYDGWGPGIRDMVALLASYRDDYGITNVHDAIYKWAPPTENRTDDYVAYVEGRLDEWRASKRGQFVVDGAEGPVVAQEPVLAPQGSFTAPALALTGCLGTNVLSAHNSSPGLRSVTIAPGADWSFNQNWVIDGSTLVTCGVYGGGVCNQASRYSNVARNLGLPVESVYHGYVFDGAVPADDNIAIWSSGGRGGQDLVIVNNTNKTVRIEASVEGDNLIVRGWLE